MVCCGPQGDEVGGTGLSFVYSCRDTGSWATLGETGGSRTIFASYVGFISHKNNTKRTRRKLNQRSGAQDDFTC